MAGAPDEAGHYLVEWIAGQPTVFSAPDSSATWGQAINNAGRVVGNAYLNSYRVAGFMLSSGQYSTFKCPGATETRLYGISHNGAIAGTYIDSSGEHGFFTPPVPFAARLRINSFIPDDYVWSPVESYSIFGGDSRTFCEDCGTERLSQQITVLNPLLSSTNIGDGPFNGAWLTQKYDWQTSLNQDVEPWTLTDDARNEWIEGWPLKLQWGMANLDDMFCTAVRVGTAPTNAMQVHCDGRAADPLIPFAPKIDMEYVVDLTFHADRIHFVLNGCHDGFPNYETYINGVPIVNDVNDGNVMSLFPPCEVEVTREGDIR